MPPVIGPELPLAEALAKLTRALSTGGVPDAGLDARIFIEDATGLGRAVWLTADDRLVGRQAATRLEAWLRRRLSGEPLWRILGQREFWGLPFAVTPDVLDPRPDTETIVSAALEELAERRDTPLRLLDLGVGSGAILGALLSECPQAWGCGVDRSYAACRVAWRNLVSLGFADRALIANGDWARAFAAGGFDLVVANPPYIETAVIATLDREVRDHDPHQALDGGADGLACYRVIAADLPRLLAPHGIAVLEAGAGQAAAVQALMTGAGLSGAGFRRDLGGHDRAVIARKA